MPYEAEIKKIQAGKKVRPPRKWFQAMKRIVKRQYPTIKHILPKFRKLGYRRAIDRIIAGIWHDYSPKAQVGILRRLIRGIDGIPNPKRKRKRRKRRAKMWWQ